jgi:O-antigen/teichoic acid export membrane protein
MPLKSDPPAAPPPRPLTGGAVMVSASRIVVTAAGATTTVVIARLLGPGGWGSYFVAQSLLLMLTVATGLGIEHGIAYYVGSGNWGARAAFRTSLLMAALLGVVGAGVGLTARVVAPSAFAGLSLWLIAVTVAALPFALARFYVSYIALAVDRYEAYTFMAAVLAIAVLVLAVPGAVLYDLEGAIVATTVANVLVAVGAVVWATGRLKESSAAHGQLRRAISFGVKGWAANALHLVNYRLDLFVLSAVASTVVVGRYSLAVAITSLMWLLPGALADVLFPRVARLTGSDDAATRDFVETKSVRHASLIIGTTAVVLGATLPVLVVGVFGADFRPAVEQALILLPGVSVVGLSSVLAATVVGRGKPIYTLYGAILVTPLTVVLYATFIPWLHANGAALASTISYLLSFVITAWFYRRVTGRNVFPLLVPTRSELDDLWALSGVLRARVGGAHR